MQSYFRAGDGRHFIACEFLCLDGAGPTEQAAWSHRQRERPHRNGQDRGRLLDTSLYYVGEVCAKGFDEEIDVSSKKAARWLVIPPP